MLIPKTILRNLIHSEDYFRKVYPYLRETYFDDPKDKLVFKLIKKYIEKYNSRPTQQVLQIELENSGSTNEQTYPELKTLIASLTDDPQDIDWLVDTTEEFCKDAAIYNGILESMSILKDKTGKKHKGQIVKLLEDAIGVSFDPHIGHDYFDNAMDRFAYYHSKLARIPFDIEILNRITNGGLPNKTLTVLMAGVGVGKTATMCHMAAADLQAGKNVLYITLEMSEDEIGKRVDANLLDTTMDDLLMLPEDTYKRKIERLRATTPGRLKIKEYPTGAGSVAHFRHCLHELKLKAKFKPDKIYVDYLNICASSRVNMGRHVGLYQFVQSVVEEVRGLAIEQNVPVVTATQLNREGAADSDPDMTQTAESWATPATADLILILIESEEMAGMGQIMIKQVKNRFRDKRLDTKFVIGRDMPKMRLYDMDNPTNIKTTGLPVINTTAEHFDKKKFAEFK